MQRDGLGCTFVTHHSLLHHCCPHSRPSGHIRMTVGRRSHLHIDIDEWDSVDWLVKQRKCLNLRSDQIFLGETKTLTFRFRSATSRSSQLQSSHQCLWNEKCSCVQSFPSPYSYFSCMPETRLTIVIY